MILNIDIGSLYMKILVVDETKKSVIHGEVIRLENTSLNVIEVLLVSAVETYSKRFGIKKVYILPSLEFIDCEVIRHESIVDTKYAGFMKKELGDTKREEKKKLRLGAEYEPPVSNYDRIPLQFKTSLVDKEVFHQLEKRSLMFSDIYIEYVDSKYLKGLNSIINSLGKEVSLISPIRAMKDLPFPKRNRIVVNYGDKNILAVVIENNQGKDYIIEVVKEMIEESGHLSKSDLLEKHEETTLDRDVIYRGKVNDLKRMKDKYSGYEVYTVGGNSNYLQNDLLEKNDIVDITLPRIPVAIENLLIPTSFSGYIDFQYNSVGMRLKNQVMNVFNLSSKASEYAMGFAGDLAIAGLIITLVVGYGVTAEYQAYKQDYSDLQSAIVAYKGDGASKGRIATLEEQITALKSGKTKNYYNIAEFLTSVASPIEIELIEVMDKDISIIAYADNVELVKQFLETVKVRQSSNEYTKFSLAEKDIQTVYRNGRKLDRVILQGRMY